MQQYGCHGLLCFLLVPLLLYAVVAAAVAAVAAVGAQNRFRCSSAAARVCIRRALWAKLIIPH